jgi:hypothetical protein
MENSKPEARKIPAWRRFLGGLIAYNIFVFALTVSSDKPCSPNHFGWLGQNLAWCINPKSKPQLPAYLQARLDRDARSNGAGN